jgi:hypothetical protein
LWTTSIDVSIHLINLLLIKIEKLFPKNITNLTFYRAFLEIISKSEELGLVNFLILIIGQIEAN